MSADPIKAKEIFLEAVETVDPDGWGAFLDSTCAGCPEIRREVEVLLAAHSRAAVFLESDPTSCQVADPTAPEPIGSSIGPYTLLERIGKGGMGVVYRAEQQEPVCRQVAVKIIRPGMDTQDVIARFEVERQALAMMNHPNIARVLGAGTTESQRPYFVMELVQGVPITHFADEHCLTTRQRLELICSVCDAVQHAHQKGIIHRDIKPSNVLVSLDGDNPTPKIIDFGIAKAVKRETTSAGATTGHDQIIGTPMYMSPEQAGANREDVDTRTDIYSLGVLLYELLTGTTPIDEACFREADADEIRRSIREEEPLRPSAMVNTLGKAATTISTHRQVDPHKLSRLLRGELDWIVIKALEKDRDRRYASASALARDIQSYLNDEPVEACPPTFSYRVRKFVRRYRVGVAASLLVAVGLAAGTSVAAWQAVLARHAQDLAESERTRAEDAERRAIIEASIATEINEFLQQDLLQQVNSNFQRAGGYPPKSNLTVREALDRASSAIGTRFHDQPLVEAGIQLAIGEAYGSIDEHESALPHLERAADLRRVHLGPKHPETLVSLRALAVRYQWVGRLPDAIRLLSQLVQIRKATLGADHEVTLDEMNQLAETYWKDGQWDRAAQLYKHTHAKFSALFGPDHPGTLGSLDGLGVTYRDSGSSSDAIIVLEQVLDEIQRRHGPDHVRTISSMHRLAIAYQKAGRLSEADQWLRKALTLGRQDDTNASIRTATLQSHLGLNLMLQQQFARAEPLLRQAVALFETESPDNWRRFHAMSLLGGSLLGQHQYVPAEPLLLQGYEGMMDRKALIFGADRLRLTESLERILQLYEMTNDDENTLLWEGTDK